MKARQLGCSLAAVSALAALLTACGPDEPDPPDPSPTTSSATTGTTDPTEPTSPTETSTGAEPASGPLLKGAGISVNAPEGWELDEVVVDFLASANAPGSTNLLTLASSDSVGEPRSLREQAESIIQTGGWVKDPKILPPVTVGGVEMYHVAGPIDDATDLQLIGTVHDGHQVEITLSFERGSTPKAEQQEITEAVWASVVWG